MKSTLKGNEILNFTDRTKLNIRMKKAFEEAMKCSCGQPYKKHDPKKCNSVSVLDLVLLDLVTGDKKQADEIFNRVTKNG